jgi:hypothetical protein
MRLSWECPRSVWAHLVEHSPQATFFHSPAWADVVQANGLGETRTLLAQWRDGRQAICVLSLRPTWGGLLRTARSGVAGGYGGHVATTDLSDTERRSLYQALWQRCGDCGGSTNPFADSPPADSGFALHPAPPTYAIRLAPLEELRRHYHWERQQAVAHYRQYGVQVRVIRQLGEDDWRLFLQLHELETSIWRQHGPPHDVRWFASLQRYANRPLRMILASAGGEPAGALIYAVQHRIATELYLAWDRRFRDHQVPTALKEACLADCFAQGQHWLDWLPAAGLPGAARFKSSFGAQPLPVWVYDHPAWPARGLHLLRPDRHADTIAS